MNGTDTDDDDPMEGVTTTPATNRDAADDGDDEEEGEDTEGSCCYCGQDVKFKHVAPNGAVWFTCAEDCCAKVGEPA